MASVNVDKVVVSTKNVYTLKLSESEAKTIATVLCCVQGSNMTSRNYYCSEVLKVLLEAPELAKVKKSQDIEGYLKFT